MDLATVLSDKPLPARDKSATDEKPGFDFEENDGDRVGDPPEAFEKQAKEDAATSAAKEEKTEEKPEAKTEAKAEDKDAGDKSEQGRDEKGRFQKTVPQEALHAARMKAQRLEQELAEARQPKAPPSVLEDEEGAFSARIAQATAPLQEKLFRLSVKAARAIPGREDYDDVVAVFLEASEKDPSLNKAFREADDPGEYAYTVGLNIKELADVNGDIMKYGEKKRSEGAAESASLKEKIKALEAEVASLKSSKEKQAKVPQSLNSESSAAGKDVQFAGPRPLKSLFS